MKDKRKEIENATKERKQLVLIGYPSFTYSMEEGFVRNSGSFTHLHNCSASTIRSASPRSNPVPPTRAVAATSSSVSAGIPRTVVESVEVSARPFFFVYSLLRMRPMEIMANYVESSSCPLFAQWCHVASTPLPSPQACPKEMWSAPRKVQRK